MTANAHAPTIVCCDRWVEAFIRGVAPECRIPAIWDAADPLALLRAQARDARLAVTYGGFPFDTAVIEALPALEFVQIIGAGYDGLDTAALAKRGVAFANSANVARGDVADYAMAMALAARRDVLAADAWARSGRWAREGRFPIRSSFSCDRAGIVGLGGIGRAIARRLSGFEVPVMWWGPRAKPGEAPPRAESLAALAQWASVLFVCCPLSTETHGLIDAGVLEALGPEGVLVSVARGAVTDEDAVIAALREGRLGAAALDVFAPEPTSPERWRDVPNVLLSPHHAGVTVQAQQRTRDDVAENIRRFFAGERPLHLIEAEAND